jgi:uncharacterized protein (DUF2249 family)
MVDMTHRILGNAPSVSAAEAGLPPALQGVTEADIVDLDVREDLRQGREPFSRIMAARKSLPPGAVLRLRATIEPVPLYGVMERQGLTHWTEQLGPDDWRIWFHAPAGQAQRPSCGTAPTRTAPEPVVLDVRDLEPPEPMVRTLQALEELPRDGTLIQLNVRVPQFLLPQLDERGFSYEVHEEAPGRVRLVIRHRDSSEPASPTSVYAGRELDVRVLPPREKHPAIFARFDALEKGESFVLVNDHDPVPLRYQFAAERPGGFSWDYLEQGPEVWRVRIARP